MRLFVPIIPPIFVFSEGEIGVYESIRAVEYKEEPQNLRGESALFDSAGNRLTWSSALRLDGKYIEVRIAHEQNASEEEFKRRLANYLTVFEDDASPLTNHADSLETLIRRIMERLR